MCTDYNMVCEVHMLLDLQKEICNYACVRTTDLNIGI